MWLLNAKTRRLEFFMGPSVVPGGYAILSHTWEKDEPTFDDLNSGEATMKEGYQKIEYTCRQALDEGHEYVWVDTVCIDKRSSAELSEAINSMYQWYRCAKICYVYLQDFELSGASYIISYSIDEDDLQRIPGSRWFTRSWTLQELIAPKYVVFFDCKWRAFGTKHDLAEHLYEITLVDTKLLQSSDYLSTMSIAKRMSWAANRSASRDEDQAYSLLGLFDIAMPMLYGEGGVKAFRRLQEEVIRSSAFADHSILAWLPWTSMPDKVAIETRIDQNEPGYIRGLLSPAPYGFRHAHKIESWASSMMESFEISHNGLRVSVELKNGKEIFQNAMPDLYYAALRCRHADLPWRSIVLPLRARSTTVVPSATVFDILDLRNSIGDAFLHTISFGEGISSSRSEQALTLARNPLTFLQTAHFARCNITTRSWTIVDSVPPGSWSEENSMLKLSGTSGRVRRGALLLSLSSHPAPCTQLIQVVFELQYGYVWCAYARICSEHKPSDEDELRARVCSHSPQRHELPVGQTMLKAGDWIVEITVELTSITGHKVWSFTLVIKGKVHAEQSKRLAKMLKLPHRRKPKSNPVP